jgi:hypothetical protein
MLQRKTLPNSQKARFVELEEEFFTAIKQQDDALEKSFKRIQDDVDKRLKDFFTHQKAQEEKMNTLITDVAVKKSFKRMQDDIDKRLEGFFTQQKAQEEKMNTLITDVTVKKSFKRIQDDIDKRLEDFFTQQKAQEEKMNTLITDVAVILSLYGLAKVGKTHLFPTDEKANERKVRLETLVNKHITSTITDRVWMGVYEDGSILK